MLQTRSTIELKPFRISASGFPFFILLNWNLPVTLAAPDWIGQSQWVSSEFTITFLKVFTGLLNLKWVTCNTKECINIKLYLTLLFKHFYSDVQLGVVEKVLFKSCCKKHPKLATYSKNVWITDNAKTWYACVDNVLFIVGLAFKSTPRPNKSICNYFYIHLNGIISLSGGWNIIFLNKCFRLGFGFHRILLFQVM